MNWKSGLFTITSLLVAIGLAEFVLYVSRLTTEWAVGIAAIIGFICGQLREFVWPMQRTRH